MKSAKLNSLQDFLKITKDLGLQWSVERSQINPNQIIKFSQDYYGPADVTNWGYDNDNKGFPRSIECQIKSNLSHEDQIKLLSTYFGIGKDIPIAIPKNKNCYSWNFEDAGIDLWHESELKKFSLLFYLKNSTPAYIRLLKPEILFEDIEVDDITRFIDMPSYFTERFFIPTYLTPDGWLLNLEKTNLYIIKIPAREQIGFVKGNLTVLISADKVLKVEVFFVSRDRGLPDRYSLTFRGTDNSFFWSLDFENLQDCDGFLKSIHDLWNVIVDKPF